MINSFAEYRTFLTKSLKKLPEEKKIDFARYIAQRLYDKYHRCLTDHGFQKEADLGKHTIGLLADMVNSNEFETSEKLENYLARLYNAGYVINAGLDLSEVYLLGRDQLINALQYGVAYLLEKKLKHLIGCAFCPFEVIVLQLVKDGIDMTNRDEHIGHRLFQEELAFHFSLLTSVHKDG